MANSRPFADLMREHRNGVTHDELSDALQELVAAVMEDNGLADHDTEPRHAVGQPFRHMAAVQRQIGASGSASHCRS